MDSRHNAEIHKCAAAAHIFSDYCSHSFQQYSDDMMAMMLAASTQQLQQCRVQERLLPYGLL